MLLLFEYCLSIRRCKLRATISVIKKWLATFVWADMKSEAGDGVSRTFQCHMLFGIAPKST